MKDVYICKISDLKVGKVLKGFYYCNDKNVKYSKNGDMYIELLLSDNKDFIYAKIWKHSEYFNSKFESGSDIAIKGKVVKYRNRLEVNVLNVNTASLSQYGKYGFKNN